MKEVTSLRERIDILTNDLEQSCLEKYDLTQNHCAEKDKLQSEIQQTELRLISETDRIRAECEGLMKYRDEKHREETECLLAESMAAREFNLVRGSS